MNENGGAGRAKNQSPRKRKDHAALAQALRANLLRRKARGRARAAEAKPEEAETARRDDEAAWTK